MSRSFANKARDPAEVDDLLQRTVLAGVEGRDRVRWARSLRAVLEREPSASG
ncbi:MAG: hypothetical protein AAGF11_22980 [Myxococcota bacterium]